MSHAVLREIARATQLREGAEGVRRVLRIVHRAGRIDLETLARRAHLPVPVVAAVRRELERRQLLRRENGLVLAPRGREFLTEIGIHSRHHFTCPCCQGRKIIPSARLDVIRQTLSSYARCRPDADVRLDQSHGTPDTALRRALLIYESDAMEGREILVLGDDDLVSLALGLLGRTLIGDGTAPVHRVTVIDIDVRLLEFISESSAREGLDIECLQHDLRHPLPGSYTETFDTFTTDPPYTAAGFELFVSRAIQALKPTVGGQGFISYAHKSDEEMLAINGLLAAMGLCAREILPAFNAYEGAQILAGSSQMIRVHTGASTRPTWTEERAQPIYTAVGGSGGRRR